MDTKSPQLTIFTGLRKSMVLGIIFLNSVKSGSWGDFGDISAGERVNFDNILIKKQTNYPTFSWILWFFFKILIRAILAKCVTLLRNQVGFFGLTSFPSGNSSVVCAPQGSPKNVPISYNLSHARRMGRGPLTQNHSWTLPGMNCGEYGGSFETCPHSRVEGNNEFSFFSKPKHGRRILK